MPSSSLLLSIGAVLSTLSSSAFATKYQQHETFTGKNWLDAFHFDTKELNRGFVDYVTEGVAKDTGLYKVVDGDVMFGVDAKETLDYTTGPGRKSVRLEGNKNYNKGLFILDVKTIPGMCGMWPAFWSLGEEPWPVKGEIDIIEGVNDNKFNKMNLHTDTKCKVNGNGQSGTQLGRDCARDTAGTTGCDVDDIRPNSFGANSKGGYYAMEWDTDAIKIWFFPRGANVPRSLTSSTPDTSDFGPPAASFQGDCDIESRFQDQRFIFTNNFCGEWAGEAYAASGCPMQTDAHGNALNAVDSCKKYVANNPKAFENQFWRIGSFKTFTKKSVSSSSSSASMSKTSSKVSSSTKGSSSASSTKVSSSSAKVSSSASSTKMSSSRVQSSSTKASSSSHAVVSSVLSSVSVHATSSIHDSSSVRVSSTASHAVSSSVPSSAAVSSSVHDSISSHASSIVHSSSVLSNIHVAHISVPTDIHVSATTSAASASSPVISLSTGSKSSAFQVYPSGQSSSAVYPSSSHAPVHYYGNFSAPVSYSVPAYNGAASVSVYGGDAPKSTPCTTSSAKGTSSTPPAYANSVPNHGGYPAYPVSSPVKNDYPYLPSFTPLSQVYPPTTSKATYDDYYQPPVSKTTITTTYTTTYVDVCETGYTTKTTTFAVTYCPTSTPMPGKPNNPPTYGWDITTKVCNQGCGSGPQTVTVTVPCSQCNYAPAPTPAAPKKPSCNGADCNGDITITTKVIQTKIITLSKIPVPESQYYAKSSILVYSSKPVDAPKSTPVVSKPVVSGKPSAPVYGNGGNGTMSIGTGVKPLPSKTGYVPPAFTGAASGLKAGSLVAVVGVVAAFFM